MKRKIAAILAADVVGYSRLIAEDEEETLRRLASYREVIDDFIAKANGRIFNTAGDAVLAEFSSAVEAVRCAIDIQESLRTRNMAYPPSRQMSLRIGITIGDVVERDGDLLGDGVNIAARLEGLAAPGGICISRTVYEQVANKLSVQFADIGAQEVKNIPNPVHAYMVALRAEDVLADAAKRKKKQARSRWLPVLAAAAVVIAAGCRRRCFYLQTGNEARQVAAATPAVGSSACACSRRPPPPRRRRRLRRHRKRLRSRRRPSPPQVDDPGAGLDPVHSRQLRAQIRDEYMSAPRHQGAGDHAEPLHRLCDGAAERRACKELPRSRPARSGSRRPSSPSSASSMPSATRSCIARARPPMPPVPYVTRDPAR